jgi:hypothetical protein
VLEQDITQELKDLYEKLGIKIRTESADARINFVKNKDSFLHAVKTSIEAYKNESPVIEYSRKVLEELRTIYFMAHDDRQEPIGQIRAKLTKLSPVAKKYVEQKAETVLPKLFPNAGNVWEWVGRPLTGETPEDQKRARTAFMRAVAVLTSEGGKMVPGRSRGPDKPRSRPRLEPTIMNRNKGAGKDTGGRPREIDRRLMLVSYLALDYMLLISSHDETTTDESADELKAKLLKAKVKSGRSDRTPFGFLVYRVFEIVGLNGLEAEESLRAYWQERSTDTV